MIAKSFTKLERYELKYHIPMECLGTLEHFLKPWCELDHYSAISEDGFYWVTSLYLDSPSRTFFRWKEAGIHKRFNMRIRTYGETPDAKGIRFFEVKQKQDDLITKTRGTLKHAIGNELWTDIDQTLASVDEKDRKNLGKFYTLATTYNAAPILLTQYKRRAWFGIHEDYSRVTVDYGMRWREETGFDYSIHPASMKPSDLPDYFRPGTSAVLELKCLKSEVPWWMLDLIRSLNLERSSFSKFGAAVRESVRLPSIRMVV